MAVPVSSKQKLIRILALIFIARSCFCTGHAQDIPEQMITDALLCFNNKVYSACNEAYRLTLGGDINVPPEATDLFCNGPYLTETRAVLSCINDVLSGFLFNNRATVRDIRYAINAGCSNTNLRGNFDVRRYMESETSNGYTFPDLLAFYVITLVTALCLFVL